MPLAEKRPTEHGEILRNLTQLASLVPISLWQYALTKPRHAGVLVFPAHTMASQGEPGPRVKPHFRSHTVSLPGSHLLNMSSSTVHTEHAAHFAGASTAFGDHVPPGTQRFTHLVSVVTVHVVATFSVVGWQLEQGPQTWGVCRPFVENVAPRVQRVIQSVSVVAVHSPTFFSVASSHVEHCAHGVMPEVEKASPGTHFLRHTVAAVALHGVPTTSVVASHDEQVEHAFG